MAYVRKAVAGFAIEQMNRCIEKCDDCLCMSKKIFGIGDPVTADIFVLMDNAITEKDVGEDYGEKLRKFIHGFCSNIETDERIFYFMNVVSCELPRAPKRLEIEHCSTYVKYAIDVVHPLLIILMGNIALNIFHKEPISKFRGNWISVHCIPAMATYNPFHLYELKGQIEETRRQDMIQVFNGDIRNILAEYHRRLEKGMM